MTKSAEHYTTLENRPMSHFNAKVPACYAKLKHGRKGIKGDGRCYKAAIFNGREYTRCANHGGHAGRPSKTGQHSELVGKRIFELAAEMENDKGLTAVEEQVKLATALLMEFADNLIKAEVKDVSDAQIFKLMGLLKEVNNMTKARHQVREGQLYTVRSEHVVLVVHAVAEAINDELADFPELRERLAKRIVNLRVIDQGLANQKQQALPPAAQNG